MKTTGKSAMMSHMQIRDDAGS